MSEPRPKEKGALLLAKFSKQKMSEPRSKKKGVLTPVVAHRDKTHKRTGIKVFFTQSIIDYHIHGETCVLSNN
jgi:hypothetical protein